MLTEEKRDIRSRTVALRPSEWFDKMERNIIDGCTPNISDCMQYMTSSHSERQIFLPAVIWKLVFLLVLPQRKHSLLL